MSFVLQIRLVQTFCHSHTIRQTCRHFLEIAKSYSEHPKACKSIKNWKSKMFRKPIFSSIYIEESKKKKKNNVKSLTGFDALIAKF